MTDLKGKNTNTALLVIDVQNDFCPGGTLEVAEGNEIVPLINDMQKDFPVCVLTQDWHPKNHSSFATNHANGEPYSMIKMPYGDQVLWPTHCVQSSHGAKFHENLNIDAADMIIRKGYNADIDSYSGFFENDKVTPTGLTGYLRERKVEKVVLTGLATDFCVNFSALDAVKCGFKVELITAACRAIDLNGSLADAMSAMKDAGVEIS